MSDKDLARRTEIQVYFENVDISVQLRSYLLTMTYTDNEEDRSDDLQITLDDRENVWLKWLNTSASQGGDIKGARIHAVIIQKNWLGDGRDRQLDCGIFEIDSIDSSGPPAKVAIKATSIPYTSKIRTQKKTKAWEKIKLSAIAAEIAAGGNMKTMFESAYDPLYSRKEQIKQSDIEFLQGLCKAAGISLKVTSNIIVLFDAAEYERKPAVYKIMRGVADVKSYRFSTNFKDCTYSSCHVVYDNPLTMRKIEATYSLAETGEGGSGQVLEVNERVADAAEAYLLAQKRLRQKNKGEYQAEFTLVGNVGLVAGVTVEVVGWGAFDGKYIVECATHNVTGGYTVNLKLRRVLEGY
jgi:phage protein D